MKDRIAEGLAARRAGARRVMERENETPDSLVDEWASGAQWERDLSPRD